MEVMIGGGGARALARWKRCPFSPGVEAGAGPGDLRLRFEREVGREPPGPPLDDGPYARAAAAILRYDVFPPTLIRGALERPTVDVGDTVGIRLQVAPGVELFFAARVIERFAHGDDARHRTGFTYRTVAGHPELGEETFSVEKTLANGAVRVSLVSWSRPGTWLTRLGKPAMRALQRYANEAALGHLARVAAG